MRRCKTPSVLTLALGLAACSTIAPDTTALSRIAVGVSPVTGEYIAFVGKCPDWTRPSREDFSNRAASNFGCADATNFVAQLADPHDAVRGRGTGLQDAGVAASAIERYRTGKIKPLRTGGSDASAAPAGPGGER
jgi:type IV pilus biogenesis protein CpaD/CtpE